MKTRLEIYKKSHEVYFDKEKTYEKCGCNDNYEMLVKMCKLLKFNAILQGAEK